MRFPLRRQQAAALASVPAEAEIPAPEPLPFPAPAAAPIDPHAGTWDELLRTRSAPRMRGQMTSGDARAERLVRQVRTELAALQDTFAALSAEHDDMLEVDPASVAENPGAALTLPPAVLVRAVVAAEAENTRLRSRARKLQSRQRQLRERLHEMQLAEAARASRLDTLEEVIAALHGNLTDLRQDRDYLRHSAPPRLSTPGELPSGENDR